MKLTSIMNPKCWNIKILRITIKKKFFFKLKTEKEKRNINKWGLWRREWEKMKKGKEMWRERKKEEGREGGRVGEGGRQWEKKVRKIEKKNNVTKNLKAFMKMKGEKMKEKKIISENVIRIRGGKETGKRMNR